MEHGKVLIAGAAVVVIVAGAAVVQKLDTWFSLNEPTGPGSGDELPMDEPTGPGSGDELPMDEPTGPGSGDEITYEQTAKGSCNTIDDASTCVEYYGSYWTAANIKLACAGAGTYSSQPCPRPAMGACLMSVGTSNEMATWHYSYGGDPFTGEVLPYSAAACNAVPLGQWLGTSN